MVSKKKCAISAISAISLLLVCRLADGARFACKISAGGVRQAERCLAYGRTGLMYGSAASSKIMSPASIAGLIGGISTTRGYMRPVRELASYMDLPLRVRPWPPSDGGSQTGRYLCLRAADWRTSRHPSSVSSGLRWPQAGVRWCGVFQVVKTAQSRGRTERTLLTL